MVSVGLQESFYSGDRGAYLERNLVVRVSFRSLHGSRLTLQIIRLVNAFYCLAMIAAKASLSVFFHHLLTPNHKWQRRYIKTIFALVSIYGLVYIFLGLFTCGNEDPSEPRDTCAFETSYRHISMAWSFLTAISDWSFCILTIMLLWNLKLRRRTKISIAALLLFGTLGSLASILRIIVQSLNIPRGLQFIIVGRWSIIEAGICIITASLATLRPLFHKVCDHFRRGAPLRRASDDTFTAYTQRTLSASQSVVQGGLLKPGRPCLVRAESKDIFVTVEFGIEALRTDSVCVPPKAFLNSL